MLAVKAAKTFDHQPLPERFPFCLEGLGRIESGVTVERAGNQASALRSTLFQRGTSIVQHMLVRGA